VQLLVGLLTLHLLSKKLNDDDDLRLFTDSVVLSGNSSLTFQKLAFTL